MRTYVAFALSALLIFTGVSVGAARGASQVADPVVLCTGGGPVTIYLDENGEPTQRPHVCPDCIVHLLDAVLATAADFSSCEFAGVDWNAVIVSHLAPAPIAKATARAPPALI